jgi:1,4-dihydroxy-2-naphthoate octaprenyltransferase
VQLERAPANAWWASVTIGLLACAILVTNNLRDIRGDAIAGKRTLAVRLGELATRRLYVLCVAAAFLAVVPIAADHATAALAFVALPLAIRPTMLVLRAASPPELVAALVGTARLELVAALLLGLGLWLS